MREELRADLHSLVATEAIDRKIIGAMRFHRGKRLWTSERTFRFNLTAGRTNYGPGDGYGLPGDLVEIVGKTLWVLIGGSEEQRVPCIRDSTASLEHQRTGGTSRGQPDTWDFFANQLRFYPTPISSTDEVEGRYVVDLGVPVVKYEAGAFKFYAPDGIRELSATELAEFNNDWLDPRGAAHLIRTRAAHDLYKQVLRDDEAAQTYLTAWLEQVGVLEDETEAKTAGATEIVPWILD